LAFAAFGSSRYLVVAADSATAAIFADGISGAAPPASAQYIALACIVAVLTAIILLLARQLRLGFIADFLSRTVLVGISYRRGISSGNLRAERDVWRARGFAPAGGAALGSGARIAACAVCRRWRCRLRCWRLFCCLRHFVPKVPGALVAVVGAIAASAAWNFAGHGIATIGPVAGGLPHLGLMALLSLREMNRKEVELLSRCRPRAQ
jgi:sulfate permease, SulP family